MIDIYMSYFRKNWLEVIFIPLFYIVIDGLLWGQIYLPRMYGQHDNYVIVLGIFIPTSYIPKLIFFELFSLCYYSVAVIIMHKVRKRAPKFFIKHKYGKNWFFRPTYRILSGDVGGAVAIAFIMCWFLLIYTFF